MTDEDFDLDYDELVSAEDFLTYFGVDYDPAVVQVNRLHILQRYHDYLDQAAEMPADAATRRALHAEQLTRAYRDFVASDALTEKVFRVFRMHEPRQIRVGLDQLLEHLPHAAKV
ncbi:Nitrogen fixation protein NifW [Thioflavicoccus mobilis 8321]|uniref:Nitrogenase-stabilizing/protective protein NifW n=1 Tax=Thioflavicoccus mobilis 8321 TaxID=765912 RepID=L0H2M7_9GAMM|nr:nitrogenase-stabilizing/protective protein NifW [Thioflavicoccus mobilis]AGA91910.1 Nitrogen fixation protein NifW [Thioflavicoccus mobilis 8321]